MIAPENARLIEEWTEAQKACRDAYAKHIGKMQPPNQRSTCGSNFGVDAHRRHKEPACDDCLEARRAYDRARSAARRAPAA